jgi:hypothetical protein
LQNFLEDEDVHVPLDEIEVDERSNYIEELITIIDREEKKVRNKVIKQEKVQ